MVFSSASTKDILSSLITDSEKSPDTGACRCLGTKAVSRGQVGSEVYPVTSIQGEGCDSSARMGTWADPVSPFRRARHRTRLGRAGKEAALPALFPSKSPHACHIWWVRPGTVHIKRASRASRRQDWSCK